MDELLSWQRYEKVPKLPTLSQYPSIQHTPCDLPEKKFSCNILLTIHIFAPINS